MKVDLTLKELRFLHKTLGPMEASQKLPDGKYDTSCLCIYNKVEEVIRIANEIVSLEKLIADSSERLAKLKEGI